MTDRGPVQVELGKKSRPVSFAWDGRTYRIRMVQECWRLMGAWWDNKGEETYFRVQTDGGGIYELRFDHTNSEWRMSAVCD